MFIEISDGFSVKIEEIEAVSQGEGMLTSFVHTHHNTYSSTFPYSVLLDLINKYSVKEKEPERQQLNILKQIGTFAG